MTAARERTAAEQLVLDQAAMWLDRYAAARGMEMRGHPNARLAAANVVDAFSVIYMLALLREIDPAVADRAARFLNAGADGLNLPQLMSDWLHAIATGQPLDLPGRA